MDDVLVLRQGHPQLSLRRFARYAGVPYWQLRDHQHSAPARCERQQHKDELYEKVRQVALLHPTSGYRLLYQELKAQGENIGLHKIRVALGELQLHPSQPRKTRKPAVQVSSPQDWPPGRRVQIDATRLSLPDGVCWIYFVLDVISRVVLASRVVRSLSMHLAKLTLDEAVGVLRAQGHHEPILVQSDGGSDFTSDLFQQGCLRYGSNGRPSARMPVYRILLLKSLPNVWAPPLFWTNKGNSWGSLRTGICGVCCNAAPIFPASAHSICWYARPSPSLPTNWLSTHWR